MQIVVSARGQLDRLNQWEADINRKFVSYTYGHQHAETGKKDLNGLWQVGLRPLRFYTIHFPEPMMDRCLSMIGPQEPWHKAFKKFLWPMRKAMNLEKIPDWKPQVKAELKNPSEFLNKDSVECVGIGMKKDRYENGIEQV